MQGNERSMVTSLRRAEDGLWVDDLGVNDGQDSAKFAHLRRMYRGG